MVLIRLAELGFVPDWIVRAGIRHLLRRRLQELRAPGLDSIQQSVEELADEIRKSPLAVQTESANEQHYEVPAEFFERVLGPRLKYSCALFREPDSPLATAEVAMLRQTCEHADLQDGMDVLELGCGWGSLTQWMAEQFPNSRITAVSNSQRQRQLIETRCAERELSNVRVITADMRDFSIDMQFDRIVSVEMFEHMRNYELLLQKIAAWLRPEGKLFVHIFCHRNFAYLFETQGASNWMGRHFFTGGMMPSESLLSFFGNHLAVRKHWRVNGEHYWRTSEAWLNNLDRHRVAIEELFRDHYGIQGAKRYVQRWRMFFMACAELFRFGSGGEWYVSHYLLQHRDAEVSQSESIADVAG